MGAKAADLRLFSFLRPHVAEAFAEAQALTTLLKFL